jgi:hypothetical protein
VADLDTESKRMLVDAATNVAKEKHKHVHGEDLDRAGREGVE